MSFVNPYFTNLRRPATEDFRTNPKLTRMATQLPMPGQTEVPSQGNWFENNQWATSDQSGVGGIGSAISSAIPSTSDGDFSVDKNAGFKGSFQGLGQGGVIGAIAGGIMGQVGEFRRVNQNLKNLQTGIQGVGYDENGRAFYDGAGVSAAQRAVTELNKGEESMKLGNGLDPATWAFAGIMGTRRRLRRKRSQLENSINRAQTTYNNADISARQSMNQMEDYYQRMDPQARLYNLYKTQFG